MRRAFIPMLWIAFACMLYINIGQMAKMSVDISEAKKEAQENPASSHLIQVAFTSDDLLSGKAVLIGTREVRYDGRLYDIVSSQTIDDKTVVQAKWDEKEENLLSEFGEYIENVFDHFPISGKTAKLIFKNIDKDYFPYKNEFTLFNDCDSVMSVAFDETDFQASSSQEIHTPPPRA